MGLLATRRLRRSLESMPLPVPFTIPGLVANMEQLSGRQIRLVEMDSRHADLRAACGLRARLGDTTWILYRGRPTENQLDHTKLHELVHEWEDHGTNLPAEDVHDLLPEHLRGEFARFGAGAVVQARGRYETREEQDAELGALLLRGMVRTEADGEDWVSLLETSLTHPALRRRKTRKNMRGMK